MESAISDNYILYLIVIKLGIFKYFGRHYFQKSHSQAHVYKLQKNLVYMVFFGLMNLIIPHLKENV